MRAPHFWLVLLVTAIHAACSAAGRKSDPGTGGHGGLGGAAGGPGAGGAGTGAQGLGGGFAGGLHIGGSGAGEPLVDEIYGHSASLLYRLDPLTKQVDVVGSFSGCTDVIDIAIDKDDQIYGTSFTGLYRIDKQSAHCTLIANGSYPNSLSFVPEGTLDPNAEALVGYYAERYVRIDPSTGVTIDVGALSGGYESSGDIVSVIGGGTYLSVTGPGCDDCLFEVDPATGSMVRNWGSLGHYNVFGLAYWGGSAYGFTSTGVLFEIGFGTSSVSTSVIPIPGAPSNLSFWGAGSSTAVPLLPPT